MTNPPKPQCPAGYHDGGLNGGYQYGCKDPLCQELRQLYQRDQLSYERSRTRDEAAVIEKKHQDEVKALRNELARANRLLDLYLQVSDPRWLQMRHRPVHPTNTSQPLKAKPCGTS